MSPGLDLDYDWGAQRLAGPGRDQLNGAELMSRIVDRTGQRFGRLVVVAMASPRIRSNGWKGARWDCQCDCGQEIVADAANLVGGRTRSCGCLQREVVRDRSIKHSMNGSPEYWIWAAMIQRCANPNNKSYSRYGGRGIKVAPEWMDFSVFFADMGRRPTTQHSIDRINTDGNYEPGNCRWATQKDQQRNRRNNVLVAYEGTMITVVEASERSGIHPNTLHKRIKAGWPESDLFKPVARKVTA